MNSKTSSKLSVVLLHGFGENPDIWDSFLPMLPEKYDYISLNYSKIAFCQTIDQYAQWVHTEMEQREITRFVILGHSMGGYIALAYAEKYPEYLAGLGLFHSTSYADSEDKLAVRDKTVSFLDRKGAAAFIEGFLPNMYNADFRRRNGVFIRQQLTENKRLPKAALIQATKAMKLRPDRSEVLKKLKVPVLFIVGKQDAFIPYEDALSQIPLLKKPYILILDHSAHAGMKEAPESCAGITTDFIEACFR